MFGTSRTYKRNTPLIIVCCILHNICILNGDEVMDYIEEDIQIELNPEARHRNMVGGNAVAIAKRDDCQQSLSILLYNKLY